MNWLKKIANKIPQSINIHFLSNNNTFKNVHHSNINLSQNYKETTDTINFHNLKISEFYREHQEVASTDYVIRNIKPEKHYNEIDIDLFFDEKKSIPLFEILNQNNKIVLLGNPGIGKTTELKNLFEQLWDSKTETNNIPFYINIKNFRINSIFEELIPYKDWESLPTTTFILDGLDEIAAVQDFISALENFLLKFNDREIKIVLSCRTNIYEKFKVQISEFKYYHLENLSDLQIDSILSNRYKINLTYLEINKYRLYLENPFSLNLFAEYYKENNKFPDKQTECWDLFILTELKKLNESKFIKREIIDISQITSILKKVACVNELMQQNFITDNDLIKLINKEEKSVLEQITFIERLPDSDKLIFRHKNYQEFFAAKFLSDLEFEQIIKLIKIEENTNISKPSLFNTLTFLLNIIEEEEKYNKIVQWFLTNEPEILFNSEPERLDEKLRNALFKQYFTENCIEKTFWIGKNGRFPIQTLARFANVDFLTNQILNIKNHFRVIISALNVLSYCKIPLDKNEEIECKLLELLFSDISEITKYKKEILRTIIEQDMHKNKDNFSNIVSFFENDYSPDINHKIISVLNDFGQIDSHFDTLENCLFKMYEITPQRIKDNTIRGTEWILGKIFLKIESPDNFLKILNILFNDKFRLKISKIHEKNFRENLITKTSNFIENDILFLYKIITAFLKSKDHIIYRKDSFLSLCIKESKSELESFKFIIENYGLNNQTFHLLVMTVSKEAIDIFIEKYKNETFIIDNRNDIEYLKNHFHSELGHYYEQKMTDLGYKFIQKLPTENEIEKTKKEQEELIQEHFDILFDKKKLIAGIRKVFEENNKTTISWAEIHEIEWSESSYSKFNRFSNSYYDAISTIIRDYDRNQTFENISKILEDDYVILTLIKDKIKNKSNEGFNIREAHKEFIKAKSLELLSNFKYDNVIQFSNVNNNGYSILHDFDLLKMLYFFDMLFDFNYPQEFYLKTLKFCAIGESSNKRNVFDFIKNKINDIRIFNNHVIVNINNERLDYFTLNEHINYALDNKLKETFDKIGEYILTDNSFSNNNLLTTYSNLINYDESFLKKCCKNLESYLCWNAIAIMKIKKIDDDFILEVAEKYFEQWTSDTYLISEALNILFYTNQKNALDKYIEYIIKANLNTNRDRKDGWIIQDLINFTHTSELDKVEDLFKIIYNDNNKDTFDYHDSKKMLQAIISNFSSNTETFPKILEILKNIKKNVAKNDNKTFYINHLLEDSHQAYYNSLSKKLDFKTSKKILENI